MLLKGSQEAIFNSNLQSGIYFHWVQFYCDYAIMEM